MNPSNHIRLICCLLCFFAFYSCNKPTQDPSLTIKPNGADQLMTINFKEIKDSTTISLSDFATDFQFIPLETRPDCLLKYASCLISKEYILCRAGEAGILQFSRNGRFIRKLVSCGKGPMEVSQTYDWAVDEENQTLLLSSFGKTGYFLSFDLKTGNYLKDISNAMPSSSWHMLLTANKELLCVPYKKPDPGLPSCLLYWQSLDGKLTASIPGPAGNIIKNGSTLYQFDNEYRFSQKDDDTLYKVVDHRPIPYLAYNYGEPNPIGVDKVGYKTTSVVFETKDLVFICLFKIISVTRSSNGFSSGGAVDWICLDKTLGKAFLTKDVFNDFTGSPVQSQEIRVQPDGTVILSLQAVDLKEIAEKALADPKTPADIRQRMEKINAVVKADDNPVLVVGRLKR